MEGLFRDTDLANQAGHRQPQLGLLHHRDDLFNRKTPSLHWLISALR
jgi:hypothetical protein